MNAEEEQVSLFGHDGCAGKMCLAHSAQGPPRVRTSASSWKKSFELKAIPFMSLDLTPGHGNLLGESYWEMISPLLGGSSILNTGPAPLNEENVSSLSQILQDDPPRKYYLSRTACLGILRRSKERGKALPPQLETALMAQAGISPLTAPLDNPIVFAANQRDEVRDLHDVAGALGAQPGMKQQTFIAQDCLTPWDTQQARVFTPDSKAPTLTGADGGGGRNPAGLLFAAGVVSKGNGDCFLMTEQHTSLSSGGGQAGQGYPCVLTAGFCAGAGPAAGSIGYQEEVAPTLKASASGNMMPSILCLNDQGGSVMECSENVTGTLRAQEHGHQPLVLYENHGKDARYKGPLRVAPTVVTAYGSGGNNLPLISPASFTRQWVDKFRDDDIASTESARQDKDATDLICQTAVWPLFIRRLTPLECERLQGFPDGFTNIPGASDSARYRALGNSVSIPCVEYIMQGLAMATDITGGNTSNRSHDH